MANTIKLLTDSLIQVPFDNYECDFTFIVNEERFETNKFIADLISPTISKIHHNDPTFNVFIIKTQTKGNFQDVLNLLSFEEKEIKEKDLQFISEILDQIGSQNIIIRKEPTEINVDNAISLIQQNQNAQYPHVQNLSDAIEYLIDHFYEINDSQVERFLTLPPDIIEQIISNEDLQLQAEDQLLRIINQLYQQDHQFSKLYEYVYFSNVEMSTIEEFFSIFDIDDLNTGTWLSLSRRLKAEKSDKPKKIRYERKKVKKEMKNKCEILYNEENFEGIFNYFRKQSNIEDEVSVTFSSRVSGDSKLLLQIENKTNDFYTRCEENQWICFEFRKSHIVPLNYSIRSTNESPGKMHPRSWTIEGSDDGVKWQKIDEQLNCNFLNGRNLIHSFEIKNDDIKDQEFKYIRMRQTGPNWYNNDHLDICSFELYGILNLD